MDRLREYKVAFRGLKEGKHEFSYVMDSAFFSCFERTVGTEGNLQARVLIDKSALLMEVTISIEGEVKAVCDRCLGDVDFRMAASMKLFVKQGDPKDGNSDDFLVVGAGDDYIDFSTYLYELYMVNLPVRIVHSEGECDAFMNTILDKYLLKEDETTETDPRWNALKNIINN